MFFSFFKKTQGLWVTGFLLCGALWWIASCEHASPTQIDGTLTLKVLIADNSGLIQPDAQLGYAPVASGTVTLRSQKYFSSISAARSYSAVTDSLGWVEFNGLPVSPYLLTVEKKIQTINPENGFTEKIVLRGSAELDLTTSLTVDTVKTLANTESPLVINEIYYAGPKNNAFFFYDQFVELYNPTDSTVYLDGLIVCRGRPAHPPNLDSVDYVQVLYIYQFPGEPLAGREYPLQSHHFTVIAQDAVNHSAFLSNALDLSGADWEFYNPYAGDIDTLAQNVVNVVPENSTDFMINMVHDNIILADGSEFYPGEVSSKGYQYYHVPISTVLDGVEYSANGSKQKELTTRVDVGFAGVGLSRYSGKSIERRLPGSDTNNSSLDFVNINHPTPGFQHE